MKQSSEPSSDGDSLHASVRVALALVRGYKLLISPHLRGSCRFLPSCADYAAVAFERHGFFSGAWLTLTRLSRCHPLCRAGHDPVPELRTTDMNVRPTLP